MASGHDIPNYGKITVKMKYERGHNRALRGSVTEVRKPLSSASDISVNHDVIVWDTGGAIIPKRGPIARALRKTYYELLAYYGDNGVLPLYREGNLYNYYLAQEGPPELAPVQPASRGWAQAGGESGPAPGGRLRGP